MRGRSRRDNEVEGGSIIRIISNYTKKSKLSIPGGETHGDMRQRSKRLTGSFTALLAFFARKVVLLCVCIFTFLGRLDLNYSLFPEF